MHTLVNASLAMILPPHVMVMRSWHDETGPSELLCQPAMSMLFDQRLYTVLCFDQEKNLKKILDVCGGMPAKWLVAIDLLKQVQQR